MKRAQRDEVIQVRRPAKVPPLYVVNVQEPLHVAAREAADIRVASQDLPAEPPRRFARRSSNAHHLPVTTVKSHVQTPVACQTLSDAGWIAGPPATTPGARSPVSDSMGA